MIDDNKALIARYFAALSGKDKPRSVIDQYVSDEDDLLKQHIAMYEAAFARYELIADEMVAEGDKVAVQARMVATHTGDLMGIPATGRKVDVPIALTYWIANGKIVRHWILADAMTLMQQLGALPTPSGQS